MFFEFPVLLVFLPVLLSPLLFCKPQLHLLLMRIAFKSIFIFEVVKERRAVVSKVLRVRVHSRAFAELLEKYLQESLVFRLHHYHALVLTKAVVCLTLDLVL